MGARRVRGFRTLLSAIAILLGAVLVVLWCGSWVALKSVDDGVVARTLVRGALSAPAVTAKIASEIESQASSSLATRGIDLSTQDIGTQLSEAIAELATSDEFKSVVLAQVDAARERLHDELASDDRIPGPFVVPIDVSSTVKNQLGDVPVVGSEISDLEVAPVDVELVSAETFDKARTAYSRLEFAKRYFLWAGLAMIVLGLAVSTRRLLVFPKFLIAIGAMALGVAAVLTIASPARLAAGLPGGEEGTWGSLVVQSFAEDTLPGIRRTLVFVGLAALAVGGVMALIVRLFGGAKH